jgi:hypothetical protein
MEKAGTARAEFETFCCHNATFRKRIMRLFWTTTSPEAENRLSSKSLKSGAIPCRCAGRPWRKLLGSSLQLSLSLRQYLRITRPCIQILRYKDFKSLANKVKFAIQNEKSIFQSDVKCLLVESLGKREEKHVRDLLADLRHLDGDDKNLGKKSISISRRFSGWLCTGG